jgi:hypothetical protein
MAKAGNYVLLDELWDEVTSKPDAPRPTFKRHVKGDVVKLDEEEATRLVDAGSVEEEGVAEQRALADARNRLRAALAVLPDHLRPAVDELSDEQLDELADPDREIPVEQRTVHTAPGFINEGHPQYAAAAHGQGDGGGPEDTTKQDLDDTQALLDSGGTVTDGAAARRASRKRGAQPGDAADKD